MANLYKRNGSNFWWAWGYDRHGKKWLRTTKQTDKKAAERTARAIELEIAGGAPLSTASERLTIAEAFKALDDAAKRSQKADATKGFVKCKSANVMRILGADTKCASLRLADTMRYVDKRLVEGVARLTVKHELSILIRGLRRVAKLGLYHPTVIPTDLMPDELVDAYVPRERFLTRSQLDQLTAELSEIKRDYVVALAFTGCRLSELYGLRADDLDLQRKELRIRGTKTARARRVIPLVPESREVFKRRLATANGGRLFPVWHKIQRDLYAACLRVERNMNPDWQPPARRGKLLPTKKGRARPPKAFDPVTPHDLRRTFCSLLMASGVSMFQAQTLMGHSGSQMIQRVYGRLAEEHLHEAMAKIGPRPTVANAVTAPRRQKVVPMPFAGLQDDLGLFKIVTK